ncbi:MAG: tRNA (adenosine(37)-N6)-threonylcarbamoyltransferase complex dimerization subunit type 1 TsaB [Pacificimonas sp.]
MLLCIGTAHRACSLALTESDEVIASVHEVIGRGHAERLLPMVKDLLAGRTPDRLIVEVGPGSFTGIRVGVAAARALALAWEIPCQGVTSMQLLLQMAQTRDADWQTLTVLLDGGRGEVFRQSFDRGGSVLSQIEAVATADVRIETDAMIGTGVTKISAPSAAISLGDDIPNVAYAAKISHAALVGNPQPLYIRPPDAKPPK